MIAYKIKGGFVGAPMMCQVLAENGMIDMAYYILFQEGFSGMDALCQSWSDNNLGKMEFCFR